MTVYFHLPQRNDPIGSLSPLVLKGKQDPSTPKPVDLPAELQFVANVKVNEDMAPLIRVLQKHPQIRNALVTALRDEGFRS